MPRTSGVVWFGSPMTEWKRYTWQGVPLLVSDDGRIVARRYTSLRSNGSKYTHKARVVKTYESGNGYLSCNIDGKSMSLVHRIVCSAFHENHNDLPCVNHINGDKRDNGKDNLEWVTYSQNTLHAVQVLGKRIGKAKLSDEEVLMIRGDCRTQREIANDYGVEQSTISSVKRGATWGQVGGIRTRRRRGEGSNVLSDDQIREIRSANEKQIVLARRYGVSRATICRVINGRNKNVG